MGLYELDLDAAVFAVASHVFRGIAEDILVAQLDSDFGGDIGEFVEIVDLILPSAGLFRDFGKKSRAGSLLRCAVARAHGFVDTDGVDLYVGFLDESLDFGFAVAAAVIAAFGDPQ